MNLAKATPIRLSATQNISFRTRRHQIYNINMKIEEAIVYVMVKRNGGMTTDQIADAINRQRLHLRKDGQPVTSKQVYATICRFPEMFTKEAGRIMLMI